MVLGKRLFFKLPTAPLWIFSKRYKITTWFRNSWLKLGQLTVVDISGESISKSGLKANWYLVCLSSRRPKSMLILYFNKFIGVQLNQRHHFSAHICVRQLFNGSEAHSSSDLQDLLKRMQTILATGAFPEGRWSPGIVTGAALLLLPIKYAPDGLCRAPHTPRIPRWGLPHAWRRMRSIVNRKDKNLRVFDLAVFYRSAHR